ncbi:MAG: L-seryl-tRNA(Sec) selenium transferase [Deltaproteobacteria bacterium]|nr:L-seryl-tRNA(Sec) selenium transferase [Deltaproteobacteria bacterium]
MDDHKRELLKNLPKIDEMMLRIERGDRLAGVPREMVKEACRSVVEDLRGRILADKDRGGRFRLPALEASVEQVVAMVEALGAYRLKRVINATGVILHTNLGRSPLCREALERIVEVARGYSNLEYDLEKGARGLRYDHVRQLLCALTGAEDALVVNNNAAAVLLVLNSLSEGKEAIVSRGELIEIGGEFRIPEVMEKSGARLREVGTTNRTRLADYERAVGPETGLILKVHTSNFRSMGFTEEADLQSLAELGRRHSLPVMDDLGSGCFIDLDRYGLEREPTVRESLSTGVDVVTFSGDKLLGGPQAGIILGKRGILERIRVNPLNRALRIDKLTLAALEATMVKYLRPAEALSDLCVLRALTEPREAVRKRARKLAAMIRRAVPRGLAVSVMDGTSMAGGGSLPTREIPTALIGLTAEGLSVAAFEERLRKWEVPIIVRVADDQVLLDARTLDPEEFPVLCGALKAVLGQERDEVR